MLAACRRAFTEADLFIATAAVGDYAAPNPSPQKMKKSKQGLRLEMRPTVDILKTLAQAKHNGQIVVGFAAETQDLVKNAAAKLRQKKLDLMVANDVSQDGIGFGSEENQATLLFPKKAPQKLPKMSKLQLANKILDELESYCRASVMTGKSTGL
jgi:phosphopantothenoylcysteine decarboxylase/phosphopantothenate--cysteine ligase